MQAKPTALSAAVRATNERAEAARSAPTDAAVQAMVEERLACTALLPVVAAQIRAILTGTPNAAERKELRRLQALEARLHAVIGGPEVARAYLTSAQQTHALLVIRDADTTTGDRSDLVELARARMQQRVQRVQPQPQPAQTTEPEPEPPPPCRLVEPLAEEPEGPTPQTKGWAKRPSVMYDTMPCETYDEAHAILSLYATREKLHGVQTPRVVVKAARMLRAGGLGFNEITRLAGVTTTQLSRMIVRD